MNHFWAIWMKLEMPKTIREEMETKIIEDPSSNSNYAAFILWNKPI